MKRPEGLETEDKTLVCKLNRSLYRLKQSSRVWNSRLNDLLKSYNFKQFETDGCIYKGTVDDAWTIVYLLLYIDDALLLSSSAKALDIVMKHLAKSFKITPRNGKYFAGLEIT